MGQALGHVGHSQHALAAASAVAHRLSLADAQVSLPMSQATVTVEPAHLALQVIAHVTAEEAVVAAGDQVPDCQVIAAAGTLVEWAAPVLVAKRLGLVDPPSLQLGGADPQRALAWLPVHCTKGQEPHGGEYSAGVQVVLLESE